MENEQLKDNRLILLTGATGYIGGRLLRELEKRKKRVRCMVRRPEFLVNRVSKTTEVVKGDVFDTESLQNAMQGAHTAYYLVHSLGVKGQFEENERLAANSFIKAAVQTNIQRIIYLGGLGVGTNLSKHLSSRQEVGSILRTSGINTIEFRASIVLGSGSLSFEMVRALVQRLPIMITPRWVRVLAQPIAVEDVITYLAGALDVEVAQSTIFEIGGADRVSYQEIMQEYARQMQLKRLIIPVPVLTPWLSSYWLALVTPLYYQIGRRLIAGVKNETVVRNDEASRIFGIRPKGISEAIARALKNEDREFAETRWCDALPAHSLERHWGGVRSGTRFIDSREIKVARTPSDAFRPIQCIGGELGWYRHNWLWGLRGLLDQLIGGVGLRRGRRDQKCLLPGDTVDFWRVEELEQDHMLRLASEMKMPGRAWLQYEVKETESGSVIRQTAIFDAVGLSGFLYWYLLYPLHMLIFKGTLSEIAKTVTKEENP
jgi:uncharacterized protein YbjT (DUF2867 family)